jgi:hypothetical protein
MLPKLSPEDFNLIRMGARTALFFPGPRVFLLGQNLLACSDPGLGQIKISIEVTSLTIKRVAALDEADQKDLGFATFQRLQDSVVDNFPELTPDSAITILRMHRPG